MSSFGLNDFKNYFNGGTRANRFSISGDAYGWGYFQTTHIRSSSIPEVSSKSIAYDHFGRKHYYPGEKQYGNWSFTVLDDDPDFTSASGYNLWEIFQSWQNEINGHPDNYYTADENGYGDYKNEDGISICQLDINGNKILKEFVLFGAWPLSIQPIKFNMAAPNQPNYFSVLMVYDAIGMRADDGSLTITNGL